MIDPEEILDRVLAGLGKEPDQGPSAYTTADKSRAVGVLAVGDCPDRGLTSWATIEASSFETPFRTPDDRAVRVEFVAAVDARQDRFGEAVASCAFEIDPSNDVKPGTVYRGAVSRIYPSATTPHLFSVSPFTWDTGFETYDDADVHVTWLQLVPITDRDAELVMERGGRALEELFARTQPDLYSIDRADTVG